MDNLLETFSVWVIPVLLAVTLHEAAHGFVAWRFGDDTAYRLGRVTLNPFRHIDPFGTVVLPAILLLASNGSMMFGFAKPVPVNFRRLRRPRRDMVLVALAGPATNLVLATVSALLGHLLTPLSGVVSDDVLRWLGLNLYLSLWINLILCVFNMLPIPPLDGGRVAVGVLPRPLAMPLARLERKGIFVILLAVFVVPWIGDKMGMDLNLFHWLVGAPAALLRDAILTLVGMG